MNKEDFIERLLERILILDGAMGTMIRFRKLPDSDFFVYTEDADGYSRMAGGKDNNDILNITHPSVIEEIHREYILSGADIIETNTFNSNAVSQQDYGCETLVYSMNYEGARIARRAADAFKGERSIIVAGSIGPSAKSLSLSGDIERQGCGTVSFDTMVEAYMVQAQGLIDGGADVLLVETVYDLLNAKAALEAISRVNCGFPVMVSATINDNVGKILSGQEIETLYTSLRHYPLVSFGLNCFPCAGEPAPFISQLSSGGKKNGNSGEGIPCAVSVCPSAGFPDETGKYNQDPEFIAACIKELALKGHLNIAGGCCGTTPEHIRAVKKAVEGIAPRKFGYITAIKEYVNDLQSGTERRNAERKGGRNKVIIGTFKGDTDNIERNIAGIVSECVDIKFVSLGDMPDVPLIAGEALKQKADIIVINGSMASSPEQMSVLCVLLEQNKLRMFKEIGHVIPLVISGPAEPDVLYMAVKPASLYSGCVIYGGDTDTAVICNKLVESFLSGWSGVCGEATGYIARILGNQSEIRRAYELSNIEVLSTDEARKLAPVFGTESFLQPQEYGQENLIVKGLSLNEFIGKIDWTPFFDFWGFKDKYPDIIYSEGEESVMAEELYENALDVIAGMVLHNEVEASLVLEFYDAFAGIDRESGEDEIVLLQNIITTGQDEAEGLAERMLEDSRMDISGRRVIAGIRVPRQKEKGSGYFSLADYFPSQMSCGAGVKVSRLGVFALKIEDKLERGWGRRNFDSLLRHSICVRLAEAMAVWMQDTVCGNVRAVRQVFGYPPCPGHYLKKTVFDIVGVEDKIGISLTEDFTVIPFTSVCGMLIAHPSAEYFGVKNG